MAAGDAGRLRWRCRRGMRELDVLLLDYLERHYPSASAAERAAFTELLELPDPELHGLVTGRIEAPAGVRRNVIGRLRRAG